MMIVVRKQRRTTRRPRSQEALQTAVVTYLAESLPTTAFFCVFPLGGSALFHGLRVRDLGARLGFPTLLILCEGRAYCIELKSGQGALQPSQRDCYAALQDARVPVVVARSLEDVRRFLGAECGLPMRNRRSTA